MIAYFDTSAVVPLLVVEAGSTRAAVLWDGADRVVSARLVYPEGRAALALAHRLGRLTARQLRAAVAELDSKYEEFDLVEVDDMLARRAGHLAEAHGLRGYDAVHLAAADRVRDPDLVVVAGDGALLAAAATEGIAIAAIG
ncbi:MAG: type II toxin-antitoxin system VapC family toxin [Actinomycetota bacterium]|nr:type II toxin-antitoxin system VapC family toxin [Actinomycetota bacterium]